jgi:hypothetical protein
MWTSGVVAVAPKQSGLLETGHQVERTSKFLGRSFSYLIEVTAHEEGRSVEMRTEQPFEMLVRYQLDDCEGGTLASIATQGDGGAFFRMAGPLLSKMVERSINNDLLSLKTYLEAR